MGKNGKENVLFLDFDDVLNSVRSFYKKFAEYHGVEWSEEDFSPKYWGQGHAEEFNPEFSEKVDKAREEKKKDPDYKMPKLSLHNYPHDEYTIKALNKIVEENSAKVVVISTWRTGREISELQEILDGWGAKCEVIGKTGSGFNRADEIYEWIKANKKIIKGICILDDSSPFHIAHLFRPWCVMGISGYRHGLREDHIAEAKTCFETPFKIKMVEEICKAHYKK